MSQKLNTQSFTRKQLLVADDVAGSGDGSGAGAATTANNPVPDFTIKAPNKFA